MSDRLVYVCEGGDCSEKGSVELFEKLKGRLAEVDPGEEKVRIRKYPCFGGCEHGINITVWPDRLFYSTVTENDLGEIVDHLENEGPKVERLCDKVKPDVQQIIWEMLDSPY
jgi:(2Fe-2S) ferredoxin